MPSVKYVIELTETEKEGLIEIVTTGTAPARTILRANVLLASDRNNKNYMTVAKIAKVYHTTHTTIEKIRATYENEGLERVLTRKKRETPPVPAKITGEVEAHVIALACGAPPEGYEKWSLRLLADKCVELNYIDSISHTTVSDILKKMNSTPT